MTTHDFFEAILFLDSKESTQQLYNLKVCDSNNYNWEQVMAIFQIIRDFKNYCWTANNFSVQFTLQQTIVEIVRDYVSNTKQKQPDNLTEYINVVEFAISCIKFENFKKFINR